MLNFTKTFLLVALVALSACQNGPAQKQVDLSNKKSTLRRIAENVKKNGDVQAAAQMEAQIIQMDQSDASSYISLADSVKQYGNQADVVDILKTGVEINPENEELKIALAKAYLEDNNPQKALATLQPISKLKNRDYYNIKGVSYDLLADYVSAQRTYTEGLVENQRDSLLLNNMALSLILTRSYDEAIKILTELSERNGGGKYAQNLALAYGLKGDTEQVRKVLGRDLTAEEITENLRIYKELR